ncbi:hypothetical protein CRENBAI_011385 [Crenichthys baileyi]|uniref:Uncharacterized protein n=1 Tax=Crenichthys baileyi TaxID=28760 RepID=A0AAV9R4C6_9TELE
MSSGAAGYQIARRILQVEMRSESLSLWFLPLVSPSGSSICFLPLVSPSAPPLVPPSGYSL